jgi:hypothetical protein
MTSDKLGAVTTAEWAREALAEGDPLLARLQAIAERMDHLLARRLRARAKRDPLKSLLDAVVNSPQEPTKDSGSVITEPKD